MRTNEWITFVDSLTTRPEMFVGLADYDFVTTFICGYNYACDGAFLAGFKEWLAMRYGHVSNVAWYAVIRFETIGDTDKQGASDDTNDQVLLNALRELLTEFMRHREAIGLRNVLYDHGVWLRQFEWFNENVERHGSSDGPRSVE